MILFVLLFFLGRGRRNSKTTKEELGCPSKTHAKLLPRGTPTKGRTEEGNVFLCCLLCYFNLLAFFCIVLSAMYILKEITRSSICFISYFEASIAYIFVIISYSLLCCCSIIFIAPVLCFNMVCCFSFGSRTLKSRLGDPYPILGS